MQTTVNELMMTTANVVPNGVIYKLKGEQIRDFLTQYLTNKGVEDINKIFIGLKNERSSRAEVVVYVFIDDESPQIESSIANIPDKFRDKVEKSYVRMSDELEKIMFPIMSNKKNFGMSKNGNCYVKLDIFRVLALMLSANRTQYNMNIIDMINLQEENDIMMSVAKVIRYTNPVTNTANNDERYKRIVEEIEEMNS